MIEYEAVSQCLDCENKQCSCAGTHNPAFDGVKNECTSFANAEVIEKKQQDLFDQLTEEFAKHAIFYTNSC